MSAQERWPLVTEADFEELSKRGEAIYETKLKGLLEPEYNNQFVAIHVDSGDYTIARSTARAMRAMREIHKEGPLVLMKIGPEPEYGLAARILAGEMQAGQSK